MKLLLSTTLLGLAWFAAINLLLTAASWVAGRRLVRGARPVRGSVLLAVRLLPATGAAVVVAGMFAPAHVLLEPADADESFGIVLGTLAAAGAALLAWSTWRAARVIAASRAVARLGSPLDTGSGVAYAIRGFGGVSLAGLLRPRIIVGDAVRRLLTVEELDVAVAHEAAHRAAFDNVKRCAIFCAPDLLGATATGRALEARWRAHVECLADARAVAGDRRRALSLASALVKVARQAGAPVHPPASRAWSTLHEPALLEARVRRLVSEPVAVPRGAPRGIALAACGLAVAAVWLAGALPFIHEATELLILRLP